MDKKEKSESKEYKILTIPNLKWTKKELTDSFGEIVAEPLETGFGITLGNALRRTLLAAVEGSAVTSVIIEGVNNEFSSLPRIAEDVMQIILNIKGIVLRNKTGAPGTMQLSMKGESVATVGDIKADKHLEIVNPDHILANISQGGKLDITFFVETGRGYRPAQWPVGKALQDKGQIFIDATFSPVRKVMFDVEKTRVGKDIDYDKLVLKITTDGAENPLDALHYSVSVLRTQLEHFLTSSEIPFNEFKEADDTEEEQSKTEFDSAGLKGISPEILLKPIEELELSVRAHNCLVNAGIKRFIDLINLSEDDGLKIKNFGRKSLNEVKDSMKAFGLSFGMNIKESDLKKALQERS